MADDISRKKQVAAICPPIGSPTSAQMLDDGHGDLADGIIAPTTNLASAPRRPRGRRRNAFIPGSLARRRRTDPDHRQAGTDIARGGASMAGTSLPLRATLTFAPGCAVIRIGASAAAM